MCNICTESVTILKSTGDIESARCVTQYLQTVLFMICIQNCHSLILAIKSKTSKPDFQLCHSWGEMNRCPTAQAQSVLLVITSIWTRKCCLCSNSVIAREQMFQRGISVNALFVYDPKIAFTCRHFVTCFLFNVTYCLPPFAFEFCSSYIYLTSSTIFLLVFLSHT